MAYKFVYFHYDRIVYVLSNVSSLQRLIPMFFSVSNLLLMFPLYRFCFQCSMYDTSCIFPILYTFFPS